MDFYRQVFAWQTDDITHEGESSSTAALFDGQPLLGISSDALAAATVSTSRWSTYIGADDLDHTLQVVIAAGGTQLLPITATPHGRLATASDPTGVTFHFASLPN